VYNITLIYFYLVKKNNANLLMYRQRLQNNTWVLGRLYTQLPSPVAEAICGTPVCLNDRILDGFTWKGNLDGIYLVKAGYKWLLKWNSSENKVGSWKWI